MCITIYRNWFIDCWLVDFLCVPYTVPYALHVLTYLFIFFKKKDGLEKPRVWAKVEETGSAQVDE